MRIGCLGAARIVPKALVHPAQVRADAVLQIVGARDGARAQAFADCHGFLAAAEGYEAVVHHPEVDLVYIALPASEHAKWSLRAISAGKHVLCEKPFAMNLDEARAVVEAARAQGVRVIEAFHHRHHPAFGKMLEWVRDGRIGSIRSLDAHFDVGIAAKEGAEIRHRPDTGGGAFMDLGCYPLAWALSVFDAAPLTVEAQARLTPLGVDEMMTATLNFPGDATARLTCSMVEGTPFSARLRVQGTDGVIDFDNPLAPHTGGRLTLTIGGQSVDEPLSRLTTYSYQLSAVLDALASGAALPHEGEEVMRQQSALDAVYAAAGLSNLRQGALCA